MSSHPLDWSLIEWTKPSDTEIFNYSRGRSWSEYFSCPYQHVNWAYKELNEQCVVNKHGDINHGFGALVRACQKYVKEHNLKEPEAAPVKSKKKGWFWR